MKPRISVLPLLAVLVIGQGCASMQKVLPDRQEKAASSEVEELRQRLQDLQRRTTMTEVEVERLRRQIAELQAEQQAQREKTPPIRPMEQSADSSITETPPSPVVIEVPDVEVADLDPPPVRSREIRAEAGAQRATVEAPPPPGPPDHVQRNVNEEGQALYDRGYTLFHRGQYLDAETVFHQFLAEFGATDLGDNAQFWIGEARFAREDLSGAMAAFRQVVSQYPDGNKVPDALLKIADCQRGLGDIEGARRSYQDVSVRFPSAAAAAVAEDRLRDLP